MNILKFFTITNKKQIEYSEKLSALTGNDGQKIQKFIRKVEEREGDEEFKRRIDYTHFDNNSVYNPILQSILKTKDKVSSITISKEDKEFQKLLSESYQEDKGLVSYMYDDLITPKLLCPGSVIYVRYDSELKQFDNIIFDDTEVKFISTDKHNVVSLGIKKNDFYFVFKDNQFFNFKPNFEKDRLILKISNDTTLEGLNDGSVYEINGINYEFSITDSKFNPFIVIEEIKKDNLYTSFIDPMIPYLYRYAELSTENALTTLRHAFPKTAVIKPPCNAPNCENGYIGVNAEACKKCNGSGTLAVSKSGFDVVEWSIESLKNDITGQFMGLSELYKEYPAPLESLKYQDGRLISIKEQAFNSIFYNNEKNSESSNNAESWRTILARKKSENEALIPFANQLINLSQKIIETSSKALGGNNSGQIVFFPQLVDLTISEISKIIEDLKSIEADSKIIEFFETKLIAEVYGKDSKEVLIRDIKTEILPFTNIDLQQISVIMANNLARKIDLFLYFNFDRVVSSIDQKRFTNDQVTKDKIKELILNKAKEMLKEVETENGNESTIPTFPTVE